MPLLMTMIMLIFLTPAQAQVRGAWERFSTLTNAESWSVFDYSDSSYYAPSWYSEGDFDGRSIFWTFLGDNEFYFSSLGASDDSFSGDLSGLRSMGVSFWLEVENSTNIDFVDTLFWSNATSRFYYSASVSPVDGWQEVNFDFSGQWWVFDGSDYQPVTLDDNILSDVDEFLVRCIPSSAAADGEFVGLDDFAVVPELVLPDLTASTLAGDFLLSFDRWAAQQYTVRKSSGALAGSAFSEMPAHTDVAGSGPYQVTDPMGGSRAFYRIDTEIFYTEIPDLSP